MVLVQWFVLQLLPCVCNCNVENMFTPNTKYLFVAVLAISYCRLVSGSEQGPEVETDAWCHWEPNNGKENEDEDIGIALLSEKFLCLGDAPEEYLEKYLCQTSILLEISVLFFTPCR